MKVHFLVHPNRDGNGSKTWWAAVEPGPGMVDGYSMHGGLLNGRAAAKTPNKDAAWLLTTLSQKTAKGYCHQHSLVVPSHQAEAIVTDAVKVVDAAVADHAARRPGAASLAVQCSFGESRDIASAIAAQMGITRVAFNV